ncbi:MAG: hypothetical protein US13_C0004G0055 [candidate division TM6 bacterium GW2011_GWE2_36_25]|nr:MAG: hypothetical protein US03_C0004G0055 [candidate division TM6 bacterium GW2011_GWF2_36_131]KKQ03233.1 MAG: hypothetical protein US13_C0004G0055 [candidate division TM6 bacterium GW2011_GWE2_36_25]KKQ19824.1 MAG: hypothetical protein US32_C0004G0008 [candidate division TM6 bacterium GW2011_GWA2_36_9]
MKTQRIRFKARNKFKNRRNAQFKKLTAGFCEHHKAQINRDKHRQPTKSKAK